MDRKSVTAALYASIGTSPTNWTSITASVSSVVKIRKGGWMAVRSCLQGLINAGLIVRSTSVENEEYSRTEASK